MQPLSQQYHNCLFKMLLQVPYVKRYIQKGFIVQFPEGGV